jgi:ArsR family transcriptional regulator, arsenate/arsenite/antimonite-responsive transcriptional repressor
MFKALGEFSRIKIVKLLSIKSMYVCELESILDMSQPRISQHLKILRQAEIVEMEKQGQRTIYSLSRNNINTLLFAFNNFLDASLEDLPLFQDFARTMEAIEKDPSISSCKMSK